MSEPEQLKEARRSLVAYLTGETDLTGPGVLALLKRVDLAFLNRLGEMLTLDETPPGSLCISPETVEDFASQTDEQSRERFPRVAAHLETCAACNLEVVTFRSALEAARNGWELLAKDMDRIEVLALIDRAWHLAYRKSHETIRQIADAPVSAGPWTFTLVPQERWAFSQPKPPIAGRWMAFGGAAPLQVKVVPRHIVSKKKDEWLVTVTLDAAATVEMIHAELRADPDQPGAETKPVLCGKSAEFTIAPPLKPVWVLVERKLKDNWKTESVELPLIARPLERHTK